MKRGDLIRLITRKRRTSDPPSDAHSSYETYSLSQEDQEMGLVLKEGSEYVKQMTVLCTKGIKFWFIHQCEKVNEDR